MPSPSMVEESKHILDPSTIEDEGITFISNVRKPQPCDTVSSQSSMPKIIISMQAS
jgi:hypothetical protein